MYDSLSAERVTSRSLNQGGMLATFNPTHIKRLPIRRTSMKRSTYKWNLPSEITARLGSESWGAQRAIFEADHLLLVLHAPPKTDGNEREHEIFLRLPQGKWLHKGMDHGDHALTKFME